MGLAKRMTNGEKKLSLPLLVLVILVIMGASWIVFVALGKIVGIEAG